MGALSVTGTAHYREPFEPLIGGVKFADFNDLESVNPDHRQNLRHSHRGGSGGRRNLSGRSGIFAGVESSLR